MISSAALQSFDEGMEPLAPLRACLVCVEASLSPQERVELYEALWRDRDALALQAAEAWLGGRWRPLLKWLHQPIADAAAVGAIAWAHLPGNGQRLFPADPAFVLAWLERYGNGADPLQQLAAMRARADGAGWGGRGQDESLLQDLQRCLALAEAGPALAGPALSTAFELAVAAGAHDASTRLLAGCVQQGLHAAIRPALLRSWLEAGSPWPLALADELQAHWLNPARLHEAGYRRVMAQSLRRPALRERWAALEALLASAPATGPTMPVVHSAWQVLAALERVHAAADEGELIASAAQALLASRLLGAPARAALQRRCAIEAIERNDPHAAAIALAGARAAQGAPEDAELLQQLLLAIDEPAVRAAAQKARLPAHGPWLGERWQDERPLWRALAAQPHEFLRPIAFHQLALLHSDGSWVPCLTQKTQDLEAAHELWSTLSGHPAYADQAKARLSNAVVSQMQAAEVRDAGRHHLWIEQPGADRVLIVFSCVDTHHSYTQVAPLSRQLPGHHLLFINNPELNWYSDEVFEEVAGLIERRVLERFARERVACHFGSMGGHAALKFGLRFGLRAVAFNPQVDLALWAAFRPAQRPLLLAAREHANVQDWPVEAYEQSPACYLVGSGTPDREAFSLWLQRVQQCRHGSFIVEKFADPHHAGLIARIAPQGQSVALLGRALQRLQELSLLPAQPGTHAELPAALVPGFWNKLDGADAIKLEIVIREGRVFVADSLLSA